MKLLFHLHTNHSYDCIIRPEFIVDYALKTETDVIAITDHDTISGSVEAADYAVKNNLNLQVIIGAEYYTTCGDIIGIFLKREIGEKDPLKLIEEIHNQGGLAVLPHPFKSHKLSDEILQKIDIIETFNPRCSKEENNKAIELAKKFNKPVISGNDAHLKTELKLCYNTIINLPLTEAILNEKNLHKAYTSKINIIRSQIVKGYKKKDMGLIIKMLKSILSIFFVQPLKGLFKMGGNNVK